MNKVVLFNPVLLIFYAMLLSCLIRYSKSFFNLIFLFFVLFNLFSAGFNFVFLFSNNSSLFVFLEVYFFTISLIFFSLFLITLIFIAVQTSLTLMILKYIPINNRFNYEKFIDEISNSSFNIRLERISFANNSRKINFLNYLVSIIKKIYKLIP